tara:strand:- start:43 stop:894 length:852 start_codon:yes stop_codon:yes gene_type:complete
MPRIYKCISAVIIILFSLSEKSALATIIKASGESVFLSNITLGCNHALNQARQKAQILAGSGKILSYQSKYCSSNEQDAGCVLDKYSTLSFDSVIVEEKKLSQEISTHQIQNQSIYTCEVQYEFDIKPINQNNGLIYDFSINNQLFLAPPTPESSFIKKDDSRFPELSFEVESSKPFYFYLFQQLNYLHDTKNIFLIYPNSIDQDVLINYKSTIPIKNDQYKFKISYPSNIDEPSIIVPLIGFISKEKLTIPSELSFDQLGQFILKHQSQITYFQEYYSVYKK